MLPSIENEILKINKDAPTEPLTILFNKIMKTQTTPEQWNTAEIMLLYKKGDRGNIKSYHLISLTSKLSNVFLKIMNDRI